MLPPYEDYCTYLASLPDQFASIQSSTLTAFTIGPLTAEVEGRITFAHGYVLTVWELLDLATCTIRSYSYELDRAGQRVWWYDPTDHPNDPTLASTAPHHKHIEPDIKHNRIPAPGLSFHAPNLAYLIAEILTLLSD